MVLRRGPRSLLVRLALGFVLVTGVGVGVADMSSVWALRHQLQDRTDRQLGYIRNNRLAELKQGRPLSPAQTTCLILLLDADGDIESRSVGAQVTAAKVSLSPDELHRFADSGGPHSLGGGGFRAYVNKLPDDRYLVTAMALVEDDATMDFLVAIEAAISLPLIGAVVVGSLWFSRRTLAPMRGVTRTARRIATVDGDLSHRVEVPDQPDEAQHMADAFNSMLTRIESEFRRRRKAETELRDFVAAASHELRTPLTAISGYAQLVRFGALDDPLQLDQAMERVQKEAGRMSLLVDELLLLARLDQGRPLERHRVDLGELCQEAVADAQVAAPEHPLTCVVEAGQHLVQGDPHRLRQVVTNLLANIAAHTRPGVTGELRLASTGDECVLDVTDEGPGIPVVLHERVFERFFRVSGSQPSPGEPEDGRGSGLGLSIVAAITRAHGGSVTVESSVQGAWFRVRLPAVLASSPKSETRTLIEL
ncbi:HAMP domain-containing histidine kinase [Streptomyces sp. NBC_00988]|uniref:sensor histidine kinase n=1 Tax=Streptomyces sp. NBC_00988 TaxID=2903704 RepID=UPI003869A097|nr:HAMP domain-containing histidine kinase [Streptomyces sp. NBC_00988]